MTFTGSSNVTALFSAGEWNGHVVMVDWDGFNGPLCAPLEHDLHQVHHYGDDGHDYGPTGFLTCNRCLGWAKEPEDA